MENQNELFKFTVVIAALFALLYVAILLSQHPLSDNGKQSQVKELLPVQTNLLPEDKLSSKFPSNLPLEANAVVTQNSESKRDDGAKQATRVFTSQKSIAANLSTYEGYMNANGWEVLNKLNETNVKMLLAKKDYQLMQVTLTDNLDKTITVNITVTEQ